MCTYTAHDDHRMSLVLEAVLVAEMSWDQVGAVSNTFDQTRLECGSIVLFIFNDRHTIPKLSTGLCTAVNPGQH